MYDVALYLGDPALAEIEEAWRALDGIVKSAVGHP